MYVISLKRRSLKKDIDQRRFGNILHETLSRLYEPLKGITDSRQMIREMSADPAVIRNTIISAASAEMRWDSETLWPAKG